MAKQNVKVQMVPVDSIAIHPKNPRIQYDIVGLANDIVANGLLQPLLICPAIDQPEGSKIEYYAVQGNRRLLAIDYIRESEPDAYSRLFEPGIPCIIRKMSESEQIQYLLDHGQQSRLSEREILNAVILLREQGTSIDAISARLGILIREQGYSKLSPKRKAKIAELRERLASETNPSVRHTIERDIESEYILALRGYTQSMVAIAEAPTWIAALWQLHEVGELPGDCRLPQGIEPIGVSKNQATQLAKAYHDANKAREKAGDKPISPDLPPENWSEKAAELWHKIKAKNTGTESEPKTREGKKALAQFIGNLKSHFARQLIAYLDGSNRSPGNKAYLVEFDEVLVKIEGMLQAGELKV